MEYISPAGHEAAIVPVENNLGSMVILPFRWATVDAFYYMESFSKLRVIKGESEAPISAHVLEEKMISQIDAVIARGGYLSILFHPFLNDSPERLRALENVVSYLARKRSEGTIWLARCQDVQAWLRDHSHLVGSEPDLDETQWR